MSEWMMGSVVAGGGAPRIMPDNAREPLQKACRLPKGTAPQAGDRVLLLRYGGGYVVVAVYGGAG